MSMKDDVQEWYKKLPIQEKLTARNKFMELIEENHFRVVDFEGTNVNYEILMSHPRVQRLLKQKKINVDEVKELRDLPRTLQREVERIEKKLGRRLHAKALKQYFRERVNE